MRNFILQRAVYIFFKTVRAVRYNLRWWGALLLSRFQLQHLTRYSGERGAPLRVCGGSVSQKMGNFSVMVLAFPREGGLVQLPMKDWYKQDALETVHTETAGHNKIYQQNLK